MDSANIGILQRSTFTTPSQELDLVGFSRCQLDGKPVAVGLILEFAGGGTADLDRASRVDCRREIVLDFP